MDYIKGSTVFPIEQAAKLVAQRMDSFWQKKIGCTRREVWVMLCVDGAERSQRQVGELLGLHPNVLVNLLDDMEDKNLLQRVRRESDRREQVIWLTEKGKRAVQTYITDRPEALRNIFSPLTDEQIAQWRRFATTVLNASGLSTYSVDSLDIVL